MTPWDQGPGGAGQEAIYQGIAGAEKHVIDGVRATPASSTRRRSTPRRGRLPPPARLTAAVSRPSDGEMPCAARSASSARRNRSAVAASEACESVARPRCRRSPPSRGRTAGRSTSTRSGQSSRKSWPLAGVQIVLSTTVPPVPKTRTPKRYGAAASSVVVARPIPPLAKRTSAIAVTSYSQRGERRVEAAATSTIGRSHQPPQLVVGMAARVEVDAAALRGSSRPVGLRTLQLAEDEVRLDAEHVAEVAAIARRHDRLDHRMPAQDHVHLAEHARRVDRRQHAVEGLRAQGRRLLEQHVAAGPGGLDGLALVEVARRRDHHRLHAVVRQRVFEPGCARGSRCPARAPCSRRDRGRRRRSPGRARRSCPAPPAGARGRRCRCRRRRSRRSRVALDDLEQADRSAVRVADVGRVRAHAAQHVGHGPADDLHAGAAQTRRRPPRCPSPSARGPRCRRR